MFHLRPAFLFILFVVCCTSVASAQRHKTELRFNAYSGFFKYRGSGSTSNRSISIVGPTDASGLYTAYPFGRKSGASYAVEMQAQRVSKGNNLLGVGIGFERLQSQAAFDSVYSQIGVLRTKGNVLFTSYFVTVSPYMCQRFHLKNVTVDVTAGLDVALSISMRADTKGGFEKAYSFTYRYDTHPVDLRPRLQVNAAYKKIGIVAGYSIGTQNLYNSAGYEYLNKKAYTNFLRLGLSYKL